MAAHFLLPDFFSVFLGLGLDLKNPAFEFFGKQAAREKAVESLRTVGLNFDFNPGGTMFQVHTGRGFIRVLAARPGGADEAFDQIRFTNAERAKLILKRLYFFGMYHELRVRRVEALGLVTGGAVFFKDAGVIRIGI